MTTTQSTSDQVITLAAQMYQHLTSLSELPFVGSGEWASRTNERWAEEARQQLHTFLVLNVAHLDTEWTQMISHTATAEAWEEYGA